MSRQNFVFENFRYLPGINCERLQILRLLRYLSGGIRPEQQKPKLLRKWQ